MKLAVIGNKHLLLALTKQWENNGFKLIRPFDLNNNDVLVLDEDKILSENVASLQTNITEHYRLPDYWEYLAELTPEIEPYDGMYIFQKGKDDNFKDKLKRINKIDKNYVYYDNGNFDFINELKIILKRGEHAGYYYYHLTDPKEIGKHLKNITLKKYGRNYVQCLDYPVNKERMLSDFIYDYKNDELWVSGKEYRICVYRKGQWAEVVNDIQTIAGHVTETDSITTKIGCFCVYNSTLKDIKEAIEKHNVDIYVDGEKVNDDIKNLEL